jgi:hypothetical protein
MSVICVELSDQVIRSSLQISLPLQIINYGLARSVIGGTTDGYSIRRRPIRTCPETYEFGAMASLTTITSFPVTYLIKGKFVVRQRGLSVT